jgi:DNA modification methylase
VTSPPYYALRDYGVAGQIGLEETPEEYIENLIGVFREVYRVLKDSGTCWVNIGDTYNGSGRNGGSTRPYFAKQMTNTASDAVKPLSLKTPPRKSLLGIPFRLALAMMEQGWILRQDIIWHKPAPMPEAVKDRFCGAHEYLLFFAKRANYYFDYENALEPARTAPGRNRIETYRNAHDGTAHPYSRCQETPDGRTLRLKRDVWTIGQEQFHGEHYAAYPQELVKPCVLCGCPKGGTVLDPFMGSGTTAVVAKKLGRKYTGIEINPEYVKIAEGRIAEINPLFEGTGAA